ncbi:MAG: late competence development ComFB family protein [Treponema sp.]|jgi:competence protein ComFB|nr:late competence development ComFB family protein [Treponema sp.]
MKLHNTVEDVIISRIEDIFETLEKEGNPENFCTCDQCRMDTACYALNRIQPSYIVSNRGAARVEQETIRRQQRDADITTLIKEGLKQVNHNQRSMVSHKAHNAFEASIPRTPAFNVPAIIGRLFNGNNFAPLADIKVELLKDGDLVIMKDSNWENPYNLVSHTEGTFTFWPCPVPAMAPEERKSFEYSIRVESPDFELLHHFFTIPVVSEILASSSLSLRRAFKLPDLYMFPPGEAEQNGYLG